MANRQNTRRIAHVKRETRREDRRAARAAIARGDVDNLASTGYMRRTTPVAWAEGPAERDTAAPAAQAEYDANASGWSA